MYQSPFIYHICAIVSENKNQHKWFDWILFLKTLAQVFVGFVDCHIK